MITIKTAFTDRDTMLGLLGRVGENGTRQIEFDCSEILTEYPAAVIVCAVKRPGEESAYYADMQAEGALRRLILRDVETEKPGTLKLELSALDGEKQRRTTLYAGAIASGLTRTDEEPSDPEKDLIDYIADAETVKQEASNAAKDALAAAGRAADAASEIENMTANAVTLAPGEPATANYNAGVLTIGVPEGETGTAATVTVGAVTTGEPGTDAAITNAGTSAAAVLNFTIPRGEKGEPGPTGPKGDTGADANVTAENIETALGYAPVTPSDLAAKQDALTDADRQSITKTGMTTGAAWTADEQAAARERMGIPGDYELIEEIRLEEDTALFMRDAEPDGTSYNFKNVVVLITSAKTAMSRKTIYTRINSGKKGQAGYVVFTESLDYYRRSVCRAKIENSELRFSIVEPTFIYGSAQNAVSGDTSIYKESPNCNVVKDNITKIEVSCSNNIPVGFLIQIFGVRA